MFPERRISTNSISDHRQEPRNSSLSRCVTAGQEKSVTQARRFEKAFH